MFDPGSAAKPKPSKASVGVCVGVLLGGVIVCFVVLRLGFDGGTVGLSQYGSWEAVGVMGDVCAAERCDSPASVLRWCRRHYDRQRKYGSADATPASEIRGWSRASESDKIVDLVAVDQVISGRRVSLNIHERRVAARRMVNDLGWTAKQAAETIGVQVAAVFRYLKEPDAEGVVYCGLSAEGYADAEGGR